MTLPDVYRKVGRGGAGNFISSSSNAYDAAQDVGAQKHDQPSAVASQTHGLSRAGRGGAGNYVDHSTADQHEQSAAKATATAASSKPQARTAWAGRGGAGNWKVGDAEEAAKDAREEERLRGEALERKVMEEVDGGLRVPGKVLMAPEKRHE